MIFVTLIATSANMATVISVNFAMIVANIVVKIAMVSFQ